MRPFGPHGRASGQGAASLGSRVPGTLNPPPGPSFKINGLLATDVDRAHRASQAMRFEHASFLALEQRQHECDDAAKLRKDLIFLDAPVVRLVYEFYARDNYSPTSDAGGHFLQGYARTLPDNKSVEDVHQPLRLDSRANSNRKMAHNHIQDVVVHSDVLEKRGVPHRTRVTKSVFCRNFKRITSKKMHRRHRSSRHQLPKHWSKVMVPSHRKDWASITEESLERASAGWAWLLHYCAERGRELPLHTTIGQCFTRFLPACHIV